MYKINSVVGFYDFIFNVMFLGLDLILHNQRIMGVSWNRQYLQQLIDTVYMLDYPDNFKIIRIFQYFLDYPNQFLQKLY